MSRLPPSLAPWSESLADLDPALAVDLGPMIHALDELVGRLDSAAGEQGTVDGYDGMTNRGDPDRMLASEWLLAEEIPLEFLRRAAENELLYLRRAHQAVRTHGRVVAVVDSGPEQLGAGRLVQLAALVVLDRRATQAGAELSLADLQSGKLATGPLASLLPSWLKLRSRRVPTTDDVERVMADVNREDRVWVVSGQRTATLLSGHRRKIVPTVTGWGPAGATQVSIRVGDSSARLPLPASDRAVAALRGEGLTRRIRSVVESIEVVQTGRGAMFNSAEPQLLWRGASEGELYAMGVATGAKPRVRQYSSPGSVLAAAYLGRRLVVVLADSERIWVRVIGKHLARVHEIEHPIADVGLSSTDVRDIVNEPIPPVYFAAGRIILRVRDTWWELDLHEVRESGAVALAPGANLDSPRQVWGSGAAMYVSDATASGVTIEDPDLFDGPLLGPDGYVAWANHPRVWTVRGRGGHQYPDIGVDEGDQVVGLTSVGGVPGLVTVTASGRIVRHVTAQSTKTWTRWAGPAHFDLHPHQPWLVRSTTEGIVVGDLRTGENLLDLRASE